MTLRQRRALISGPAKRDLQNIYDFASQFDEDVARRLIEKLATKFFELAEKGIAGSSRAFLPPEMRAFPFEKHCFYFTVDDDKLTLLRVLHGAQSIDDLHFDPSK